MTRYYVKNRKRHSLEYIDQLETEIEGLYWGSRK